MDAAPGLLVPTLLAVLLSTAITLATTIAALGPRSLSEARAGWRRLRPMTPDEAEKEIAQVEAMRRDPETANMFFLSRFIVMVVQESVGQLLVGLLAAVPFTGGVSDKIVQLPFALGALWLALICLITYRRIVTFERWSASLRARVVSLPERGSGRDREVG